MADKIVLQKNIAEKSTANARENDARCFAKFAWMQSRDTYSES